MATKRSLIRLLACAAVMLAGTAGTAGATSSWTTYHGDPGRSGFDGSEPSLSPTTLAWSASLDGSAVYGQPLVYGNRVYVADEADQVYALDAHDGQILWHASLGAPLTNVAHQAGCGDIDPLGVTSTPVIDPATGVVYVVGEVSTAGQAPVHHQMFGFDAASGAQVVTASADPPLPAGESALNIQQRSALAVGNGRVYVGYGGLSGDCGAYHGWMVGVDEAASRPNVSFEVAPDGQGGAIWGAGGPAVLADGDVVATTGNPNPDTPAKTYTESAVELSPSLSVVASYQSPASGDADLASDAPTVMADGDVFVVGKADVGYVLAPGTLAPVETISGICGSDPDGGNAYDAATNTVYVPCRGGSIEQVHLSGSGSLGWQGGGSNGPPILVDGSLWTVPYGGSSAHLEALDPATGSVRQSVALPAAVPTFTSPSAADGLLLVGTVRGIVAFDGPSGVPPSPPPPGDCSAAAPSGSYLLTASDGGEFSFGGQPYCGSTGGLALAAQVVASAVAPNGGYWSAAADGGVFAFGAAQFHGSTGGIHLAKPVVGMAPTPDGGGYWLVASDGGVFAFGDARFAGSTGGVHLAKPVVGMAPTPDGGGYWLVASDGGVFAFGDARFAGSTGAIHLAAPIVAMASSRSGAGYWLVASDGGVFSFGDAAFHGSAGGTHLVAPVVGMAATATGGGYWLAASDGGVLTYGDAPFAGSLGGRALDRPVVAIAS